MLPLVHYFKKMEGEKMSLSAKQRQATTEEFYENIQRLGSSFEEIAIDLETTPQHVKQVITLKTSILEEPWILRDYLLAELAKQEKTAVAFSALLGQAKDDWFLDQEKIQQGTLKEG